MDFSSCVAGDLFYASNLYNIHASEARRRGIAVAWPSSLIG
jgi:hypothetical protein